MLVTDDVSQFPIGWLNAFAFLNIFAMFVTEEVSQLPMGWLKDSAPSNMYHMDSTFDVSHSPMGWLKALAPWNMAVINGLWFLATTWHGQIGPGLSRPHPDPLHHRKGKHALPTSNVRIQIDLAHVKRLRTGVVASGLDFAQLLPDMRALFHTNKVDPFRTPA